MLIIGDIAGQYKTLMALLQQCPNEEPVSVGDMIDRGPQSKEVLDFFMKNGRAIMGNHESMMLDAFASMAFREFQDWVGNGGGYTLRSFGIEAMPIKDEHHLLVEPYLEWMDKLPLYIQEPGLLITHAPWCGIEPSAITNSQIDLWLWNRELPDPKEGVFQVFGHNSYWGLRYLNGGGGTPNWGVCIDTSHQRVLTGLEWPSMKTYQQPYID